MNDIEMLYIDVEEKTKAIYRFVSILSDYPHRLFRSEDGESLSMAEAYMLDSIDDEPGITLRQLAELWGRTGSAMSQTATKLEKKGFIFRKKLDGDDRLVHLYNTPAGHTISREHKKFSANETHNMLNRLLQDFTEEEIQSFFKILDHEGRFLQSYYKK